MARPPTASDHLDSVVRIIRRTGRFWRVGLVTLAIGIAATFAAERLRPRLYRSEAVVHYQEGMQWTTNDSVNPRRIGQRLKDSLLARAQLARVIEGLGLYPNLVKAGRAGDAVEEMRLATTFKVDGDIFVISYTGNTPEEAQRVTARLTEVLIEENTRLRSAQAEVASAFLDSEKKRNEADLAAKEAEQLRFLAKHPEFAQEATTVGASLRAKTRTGPSAPAPRPAKGDNALGALRREEERLRRQLTSPGQVPPAPRDPALAAARSQAEAALNAAQRELADRRARFTEQHPDVRTAAAMVKEATDAYRRAVDALDAGNAPVPVAVLEGRLAQVQRDITDHLRKHPNEKAATDGPVSSSEAAQRIVALETEWARLNREVAEARERFQELDARQFMASMTASTLVSGQAAQIVVIDPAFLPAQPIGMSTKRLFLMGILMTVASGFGLAILRGLVDDRIYDHADVARLDLAPFLVEIPRQGLAQPEGGEPIDEPRGRSDGPVTELDGAELTPPGAPNDSPWIETTSADRALPQTAGGDGSGHDRAVALVARGPMPVAPSAAAARDLEGIAREVNAAAHLGQAAQPGGRLALLDTTTLQGVQSGEGCSEFVRVQRVPPNRQRGAGVFMLDMPDSPAAASFRVLRHRLDGCSGVKVVLVTSPEAGEGKSQCALNLALAMAEAGRARVLLLEANFRRPSLSRALGFEPPVCVSEQLEFHRTRPAQPWAVVENVSPWLHTVAIATDTEAGPLLDGPALGLCIEDFRRAGYDHIIIDGPPILDGADVNLLEEHADGIVVVLLAGKSRARALRKAVDQVGASKLLGVALLGT